MSDKFKNWQEVIVDFFENRVENIKSSKPKIPCKLYKAREYIEKRTKEIELEKDAEKCKKIETKKNKKIEELKQLRKAAPATEIRSWIKLNHSKNIKEGLRIIKATHVLKFTHSSSAPGGLLLTEKTDDLLLSTASLKRKPVLDLAHNNGALITISRFLALMLDRKLIIDLILDNNFDFLKPFAIDKTQLDRWQSGIVNLIEQREIRTADKAKQIYFPLKKTTTKEYHLIIPLFSSSLCNEIDVIIDNSKYGELQKEINNCKKNTDSGDKLPKYHSDTSIDFYDLGIKNFDRKHPNNVSMLNANRGGKVFLFSIQPPTWQSQRKPPVNKSSMFDNYFPLSGTKENIDYIRDFLLRFEHINLSIKNPEKQEWITRWVNYIIDDFLFYVATIQNLPSGWSDAEDIKLKIEHQYLLDPHREDAEFQINRKSNDWQAVICADFSRWLNNKLRGKDKQFTPQKEHTRMWQDLIKPQLREHEEIV